MRAHGPPRCTGSLGLLLAACRPAVRTPLARMNASPRAASLVGLPKAVAWGGASSLSGSPLPHRALRRPLTELFTVLGIETSCDDTGVAVIRSDGAILGECVASQAKLHEEWGGVVPGLARDAHVDALDRTIATALERAGMTSAAECDAIAVTVGPGLEICLRVGAEEAKRLAAAHDLPFVGVHHLEAPPPPHPPASGLPGCMACHAQLYPLPTATLPPQAHVLLARMACDTPPAFPFLTLLVSGGHCQLLLSRGVGDHVVLGSTLDDALGEAYDKVTPPRVTPPRVTPPLRATTPPCRSIPRLCARRDFSRALLARRSRGSSDFRSAAAAARRSRRSPRKVRPPPSSSPNRSRAGARVTSRSLV